MDWEDISHEWGGPHAHGYVLKLYIHWKIHEWADIIIWMKINLLYFEDQISRRLGIVWQK